MIDLGRTWAIFESIILKKCIACAVLSDISSIDDYLIITVNVHERIVINIQVLFLFSLIHTIVKNELCRLNSSLVIPFIVTAVPTHVNIF